MNKTLVGYALSLFFASSVFAQDIQPRYRLVPELGDWSTSTVPNLTSAGTVTGTTVAATDLDCTTFANGGAVTTNANGEFVCSADDTGGGGGNSFETIAVPAGTAPVADSSTDTLTITETSPLVLTGTAATDTIDITWATLTVAEGGTGATTLTDGGILLGSGTGAFTALGVATNGQIPIGDGTTDPVLATITGTASEITVTNGAGTITLDLPLGAGTDITADLEEETHATEHSLGGTDAITVTNLASACTDAQVLGGTAAGTGVECQTDAGGSGATDFNLPVYSAKLTGAFVVFTPPTADACTQGAQIDAGDGNWRLLFDPTTDECATWQFVIPSNYASTPTLTVFYSMTSATALEVEFEAAIMCVTPADAADVGTASFSNVAVASETVPGTAGYMGSVSITLTDDSCAAGDVAFVVLSTDANDATSDDATGDREVIGANFDYS